MTGYTIDSIPFSSFGLYLSKSEALHDLPELKEQQFTKYRSEGFQITKRKNVKFDFNGFIIGTSLAVFQSRIRSLYKIFSAAGTRNIKIRDEVNIECFATEGFDVDNVYLYSNMMIANIKMSLNVANVITDPAAWFLEFAVDGATKGPGTFRIAVRNYQLCWDRCLTSTGFDGIVNLDWENLKSLP